MFLMTANLNTVSGGHLKYSHNLSTLLTESRYGDLRLFGSSSLFFLRLFCSLLATKEYLIFMPSLRSGTIKFLTVILCWSPELKAISLRSIWPMNLSSLSWLEMKKKGFKCWNVAMIICEIFRNFIFIYLLDYEVRSFTSIVFQSEKIYNEY